MKAAELKTKTKEELNSLLLDLKKEALNLRFQKVVGELANTARMKDVRRTIARVNTIINQKSN